MLLKNRIQKRLDEELSNTPIFKLKVTKEDVTGWNYKLMYTNYYITFYLVEEVTEINEMKKYTTNQKRLLKVIENLFDYLDKIGDEVSTIYVNDSDSATWSDENKCYFYDGDRYTAGEMEDILIDSIKRHARDLGQSFEEYVGTDRLGYLRRDDVYLFDKVKCGVSLSVHKDVTDCVIEDQINELVSIIKGQVSKYEYSFPVTKATFTDMFNYEGIEIIFPKRSKK